MLLKYFYKLRMRKIDNLISKEFSLIQKSLQQYIYKLSVYEQGTGEFLFFFPKFINIYVERERRTLDGLNIKNIGLIY